MSLKTQRHRRKRQLMHLAWRELDYTPATPEDWVLAIEHVMITTNIKVDERTILERAASALLYATQHGLVKPVPGTRALAFMHTCQRAA